MPSLHKLKILDVPEESKGEKKREMQWEV